MKKYNAQHLLSLLFLASVFLICLTKIVDTDAWLHLMVGREIFNQHGIPPSEVFTYPSLDRPFGYSSWLFGPLLYIAYHLFDVYGVILLKALTITATFYVLLRDSLLPHKNYPAAIIVLSAAVFIAYGRFVERPDTFLMLFLAFTIYALDSFMYENKKYIYALPLIHILWANFHSSVNLTFAIFLPYVAVSILQALIAKRFKDTDNIQPRTISSAGLKTILLIFILSIAASLINPSFIKIYTGSAKVLASSWWQDEIVELAKPTWKTNKTPFILTPLIFISFILNWFWIWRNIKKDKREGVNADNSQSIISRLFPMIIHFLIILPFIALSFTALRFIFILGIVSAPIFSRNIAQFLSYVADKRRDTVASRHRLILNAFTALAAIWIIVYSTLFILRVEPFGRRDRIFGFGFNYSNMPEGALKYMDTKNIYGRMFNLFQWGQYITWRDFPKRSAFVDGRGYLTADLLEALSLARAKPPVLDNLHEKYGFEAVLLDYPMDLTGVTALHYETDLSLANPAWALVYWDDVSTLYLRRGGPYDAIIKEDEFKFIKPVNNIEGTRPRLNEKDYVEGIVKDLKRTIDSTGSSKAHYFLGFIYNEKGLYSKAIAMFDKVENKPESTYLGLAYAYGSLNNLDESIKCYKMAFDIRKNAVTLYNISTAYSKKGDDENALKYLSDALKLDAKLTSVYPKLIQLYQKKGMEKEAEKTIKMYESAKASTEGEEHFKTALKAFFEKKPYLAAEEYKKSIEVNPSNPEAYSNLGYIYYDMDMLTQAYEYQRKALDLDPDFANAHYGLALIYLKWNDPQSAKKHFQKYIEAEPSGYFTRRAREEIDKLK